MYDNQPDHSWQRDPDPDTPDRFHGMRPHRTPSNMMASASMVCAVLAIITFYMTFTAIFFGALAIIFGLLSRGGQKRGSRPARLGIRIGIAGIVIGAGMMTASMIYVFQHYGSMDRFYRSYGTQIERYMNRQTGGKI